MIVRPKPNIVGMFLTMRGSIVPRIAPQLLCFALYSCVVVTLSRHFEVRPSAYGVAPFTVLGVALSIYLGFRNNSAYDRWWEARKLWGQLVFEVRNFARAVTALVPADSQQARPLLMETLAFCHYLRGSVRKVDAGADARRFIDTDADVFGRAANPADAVLRRMAQRCAGLRRAGRVSDIEFSILDQRISGMAAIQAGCERISSTPVPFTYTLLLHRSTYWFCLLLPVGLGPTAGWMTPLFTVLVAYSFFGLDALSEELEDPFGTGLNDLALDALCRTYEISVAEALGEPPPPPLAPDNFYLS